MFLCQQECLQHWWHQEHWCAHLSAKTTCQGHFFHVKAGSSPVANSHVGIRQAITKINDYVEDNSERQPRLGMLTPMIRIALFILGAVVPMSTMNGSRINPGSLIATVVFIITLIGIVLCCGGVITQNNL